MIIVASPNIVSLATTDPNSRMSSLEFPLEKVFRQANANPENTLYLRNLRSVYMISKTNSTFEDGRFYVGMDLHAFLRFFNNLPSIESISTDAVEDYPQGEYDLEKASSNISRIFFHHSSLRSLPLAGLIWSCKALKEFQYSIGGRSSNDGGYPIFNPKAIVKALCDHKDTIEVIDIDTESRIYAFLQLDEEDREHDLNQYGSPYEEGIGEDSRQFLALIWKNSGSLKEFVSLKRLSLGVNFLLYFAQGVSVSFDHPREGLNVATCLPNSLEYLCVRGYEKGENKEHDEQMNALMAFYKSGQSQLKELKGIEETIPNADHVDDPDGNDHLLWSLKESGDEDEEDEDDEEDEEDEEER
jgi:hypothetical protein